MILGALAELYEDLAKKGKIAKEGYGGAKAVFALVLGPEGELKDVMPLKTNEMRGKKTVEVPLTLEVPYQDGRSSGVHPYFLCDTAAYFLGLDTAGKPERALRCYEASRSLHREVLEGAGSPAARAVLAFFERWEPEKAAENPLLREHLEELKGGMGVFRFAGRFVSDDAGAQAAWNAYRQRASDAPLGCCMVTGKRAPIARLHASIKGVKDAQSSGASLVSFNAPAFESYGKEQSYNAPVGEHTAFAYTSALNYLLADRRHVRVMGGATVVFWAKGAEPAYQDVFGEVEAPGAPGSRLTENDLEHIMNQLSNGEVARYDGQDIDPSTPFYVLGLSPNAARISVRFFYQNDFGDMIKNIQKHYARLEIVRPPYDKAKYLSIGRLLYETVNKNSKDKSAPPLLSGALYRAVLGDTNYPEALWNGAFMRIRAEHNITRGQAAILKAVLLKRSETQNIGFKEVITVQSKLERLDEETRYLPYVLGRLFAVLESIQRAALPNLNTTIKDRYFNSACATPGAVFPVLIRLSGNHLKVVKREKPGLAVNFSKQLTDLIGRIDRTLPSHMTLEEQGTFYIGYYHQTEANFAGAAKKEEK